MTKARLQDLLSPLFTKLDQIPIKYSRFDFPYPGQDKSRKTYLTISPTAYFVREFPTYLDSYNAMTPSNNITNFQLGGRFFPCSVVDSHPQASTAVLRTVNDNEAVIVGVSVDVSQKAETPFNAVNPAWRKVVFDVVLGM